MQGKTFYENGLRFECRRCSKCCRHTPGYVFLSETDVGSLLAALNVSRQDFLRLYCRRVNFGPAQRLSLKEKRNVDCILWEGDGCSVYAARPLQCRSFPFWSSCLSSAGEWDFHSRQCPGMGEGRIHSKEEIEAWLAQRLEEPFIEVEG